MTSLDHLHGAWKRSARYAETVLESGWLEGRSDVSEFWREYLDARNPFPDFNDAIVLRRGATWPMAERAADAADPSVELPWATSAWFVASREVPPDFLDSVSESAVGAPVAFEFGGRAYSAGFLTNALTAWRITDWVRRRGRARPLRILEIGAGYGQVAHLLHQVLPIELYAVCDLLENLFLGSYFLQANLFEKAVTFVGDDVAPPKSGLAFTIPPFLSRLGGPWDVIINTYSFQEMTYDSVHEYFAYAKDSLADDGFLYSLNSHGKQGAGIARPGDYPAAEMTLLGFGAVRRFPFQALATHPYELVFGAGPGSNDVARAVDVLGQALQFGLHAELQPMMARVADGSVTQQDVDWISACERLFSTRDKRVAAETLGPGAPEASEFLRGALAAAAGEDGSRHFRAVADARTGSYANALALVMLGRGEEARALVPFLGQELGELAAKPRRLGAHFGRLLGFDDAELPRRLPRRLATMASTLGAERIGSRSTRSE